MRPGKTSSDGSHHDNWLFHGLRWLVGMEGVPLMSRPCFRYEFWGIIAASLGFGAISPVIIQLFLTQGLGGPDYLIPLTATVLASVHLLGTFIAQFLQRRRAIPYMVASYLGLAACCLIIALLPATHSSVLPTTITFIIACMLLASVMSIRTVVRHSNYPDSVRGKVVGRLIPVGLTSAAISAQFAGFLLDNYSWAHHVVYTLGATGLTIAAWLTSRIRIRREILRLRFNNRKPIRFLGGMDILIHDRSYRNYQIFQSFAGGGNMLIGTAALLQAVRTKFNIDYAEGAVSFVLLPSILSLTAGPIMGIVFDKMKILKARLLTLTCWWLSRIIQIIGLMIGSWGVVLLGFGIVGLAQGSAGMVWQIGHMRFAPPEKTQDYMGIHLTFVGIRGLILPGLGFWLYETIGLWVFAIGVAMGIVGMIGFALMKDPEHETNHAGIG